MTSRDLIENPYFSDITMMTKRISSIVRTKLYILKIYFHICYNKEMLNFEGNHNYIEFNVLSTISNLNDIRPKECQEFIKRIYDLVHNKIIHLLCYSVRCLTVIQKGMITSWYFHCHNIIIFILTF